MSILLADIDATCSSFGYSDGNKYYIEDDAIQCLKHIIWILRRDNEVHEFRRYIGHKKVIQTDLIPMLIDYCENIELADVLLRLIVNLTNPTFLLYKEELPKDGPGRRNYLDLVEILQDYKEAFVSTKAWAVLGERFQKILEIDVGERSEEQGLILERILVLIRNVLQVPSNPEHEKRADNDASLHDQVLWALHESGIFDLILFILSSEYELQYQLHALEIVSLIYREQKPEALANALLQRSNAEKQQDEQQLITALKKEKMQLKPPPARHSRFGGTYVVRNMKSVSDRDVICHQSLERAVKIDFSCTKAVQKKNFRIAKEDEKVERQSVFAVRLFLREYCIEILTSAYNNVVRQVRRTIERNAAFGHDDSYLMWLIRFFMEFNRLNGFQLHLVSESLSVNCVHWITTRLQHNQEQIIVDKRHKMLWNRRIQLGVQAYREVLFSMQVLEQQEDETCKALYSVLRNNIFYVAEYREIILQLLLAFNDSFNTKSYLRDVIDTTNIYLKMMQKFCQGKVVVQKKKKRHHQTKNKESGKSKKAPKKTKEQQQEDLERDWDELVNNLSVVLSNEINVPEEDRPIPFDAASEKAIDDQKGDCMIRIHKMLRDGDYEQAVLLIRAAREVWPDDNSFGKYDAAPEDELMLLKEVFMTDLESDSPVEENNFEADNVYGSDNEGYEDDGDEEDAGHRVEEVNFNFEDFCKRLLNPKVTRACTIVLHDWETMTAREIKSTVTIMHRIAVELKFPAMLFQAQLFKVFQQVFHSPKDARYEELRRLGIYIIRQFVKMAKTNPKIYMELPFFPSLREAKEIEFGYTDVYNEPTKNAWSEAQEDELRRLYMENQENPQNDQDVIDWILDNLVDKTRTRRGIVKKLKELGLIFKAPTKRSTAAAANKNLWRSEEDEQLRELYDTYRLEKKPLIFIMENLSVQRSKNQIIKRMLSLGLIADRSEIVKTRKRGGGGGQNPEGPFEEDHQNQSSEESGLDSSDDEDDSPQIFAVKPSNTSTSLLRQLKPNTNPTKKRTIKKSTLDLRSINVLRNEIEESHKDALDWIIEAFNEAAEDFEETSDDPDDAIPIVPITGFQNDAIENEEFKKLLVAVGVQKPDESEKYWRIPANLTPEELKYRSQLLANEISEQQDTNEENATNVRTSNNSEDEDDVSEAMFSAWRKKDSNNTENHNLIYNQSDDEDRTNDKEKGSQNKVDTEISTENLKRRFNDSDVESDNENNLNRFKRNKISNRKTIESSSSDEEDENEKKNAENEWKTVKDTNNKIDNINSPNIHNGNEIDEVELNGEENNKQDRLDSFDMNGDEDIDVGTAKTSTSVNNQEEVDNGKKHKRIRRVISSSDEDD